MPKILIVDDALFMREVIRGILQSGGYADVSEAEDGDEALSLYREQRPDLVMLDITMPGVDGVDTLRAIREIDPEAKVVMCSAIGQEKQVRNAIRLGAADYIVKPFKPDVLLAAARGALGV